MLLIGGEHLMTICVSNLTVSTKAAAGAIIGAISVFDTDGTKRNVNLTLSETSAGFFNVSGGNLVTLRAAIPPGFYHVFVRSSAQFVRYDDEAHFVLQVTAN
jgi:hypothetical protein